MPNSSIFRLTLVVMALYAICCAIAAAQTNPHSGSKPAAPGQGGYAPAPYPSTGELLQRNDGSLLKASLAAKNDAGPVKLRSISFISVPDPEPRTLKKHDLVTIVIREESTYSAKGNSESSKESALDAKIEEFIKLKLSNWELQGGNLNSAAPSIKYSGSRDFKGEGTVDRSESLTQRVAAEVIDVKPNGTLVLQARKHITFDEEEQELTLTGTCRAEDVTADNTILSTQLHDQVLVRKHKGMIRDATHRGWIPKLLDVLNPF